jgi:hypothetical protein
MQRLTKIAYEKAVTFLHTEARPLERARYAYHFQDGTAADVLAELGHFQNGDGGFGHGLEPDVRLLDSSVIATTLAFQHFRELGVSEDHALVTKACRYLKETYDSAKVNWHIVPSNVDDAPHAPWWVYGGDLDKSLANPRAEIAGYLNEYQEYFPAAMRQQVTEAVINYLLEQPDKMEMHDLLCYIRFWETKRLAPEVRSKILDKLMRIVDNTVERSPEGWKSYGLQPLAVVSTPASPFAGSFRSEIEQNLDFIVAAQGDQGGWMPNWT